MSHGHDELEKLAIGARASLLLTTLFVPIWAIYTLGLLDVHFHARAGFQMATGFVGAILASFPVALVASTVGRLIPPHRFFTILTLAVTAIVWHQTPNLIREIAAYIRSQPVRPSLLHKLYPALLFSLSPICFGSSIFRLAPSIIAPRTD